MHPCRPEIPEGCLEGLEQYSHVWVLYIFHCNTDLQRLWSPDHASDGLKAKVQVPRLNGQRMGVLATRSPHRPSPIGENGHRILWTSAEDCSTPAASWNLVLLHTLLVLHCQKQTLFAVTEPSLKQGSSWCMQANLQLS